MKSTASKKENSTVEIKASLPADDFAGFRAKAITYLSKHANIDGFRKGNIPEDVLISNVGEGAVLTQMAELALDHHYPALLKEHNVAAIGQPQITVTKLAEGNPFEVTITTAVLPDISLGDFKKTAKSIFEKPYDTAVTDEEAGQTMLEIRKQLYAQENPPKEGEKPTEPEEKDLPVLDDAAAQKMGAKNFEDFEKELKNRMGVEKQLRERDRRITELLDTLVKEANLSLPDLVIEAELSRMMAEMKADIERMGIKFDVYLEHIKKTEEELKEEHRESATKRASSHLILKNIAAKESITVPESELQQEVTRLKKQYPDTNVKRLEGYVNDYLENQAVVTYLESLGSEKKEEKK